MKDSQGNELNVGDQFYCKRWGVCKVELVSEDRAYMTASSRHGSGFGASQVSFNHDMPDARLIDYFGVHGEDLVELQQLVSKLLFRTYGLTLRASADHTPQATREQNALTLIQILIEEER